MDISDILVIKDGETCEDPIQFPNGTESFCRRGTNSSEVKNGTFEWTVRLRICPWEGVISALEWFQNVHHSITLQCVDVDGFCNKTYWEAIEPINESYKALAQWTNCSVEVSSDVCTALQDLIVSHLDRSFAPFLTR